MNLKDLHYLVALAEYQHFGKAAKACFVSQPTLSVQIHKLEEALGTLLFESGQKYVILTPIGCRIVEQVKVILEASHRLKQLAKSAGDPLAITLRLGLIPTLGPYLLPAILSSIKQSLPKLELFLYEDKTENLLEKVKTGKLDAVILALPIRAEELLSKSLFKEAFFLVLPANHSLKTATELRLDDLQDENLLLLEEGHCLREQALEVCHKKTNLKEKLDYRATSLETLRHMVAAGAGITLLPLLALETQPSIINKRLAAPVPQREIAILWRKASFASSCCEKLAQIITTVILPVLSDLEKQL